MMSIARRILCLAVLALACLPAAFVVTILLLPVWRWIETAYGIEAVGHSGPADWCFELVYALLAMTGLVALWRWDRRRAVR
jgi:hypothetical protein